MPKTPYGTANMTELRVAVFYATGVRPSYALERTTLIRILEGDPIDVTETIFSQMRRIIDKFIESDPCFTPSYAGKLWDSEYPDVFVMGVYFLNRDYLAP